MPVRVTEYIDLAKKLENAFLGKQSFRTFCKIEESSRYDSRGHENTETGVGCVPTMITKAVLFKDGVRRDESVIEALLPHWNQKESRRVVESEMREILAEENGRLSEEAKRSLATADGLVAATSLWKQIGRNYGGQFENNLDCDCSNCRRRLQHRSLGVIR